MGDRYQPEYGYDNGGRDDRRRGDYYDRYERDARYDDPRPRGADYTFRGAADRQQFDNYRPQDNFSFRAQGPPAPHFPPADQYRPPHPQQSRPRPEGGRHRVDMPRRNGGMHERGGRGRGGRGRAGFSGRAAHKRDILSNTGREPTPEQLEGMNLDGHARFRDEPSDSEADDEGEIIDLTGDDELVENGGEAPRKRIRTELPTQTAAPKWSNPDPYTALPPPETLGAPKKDIVQVIRKAKLDATKADGQAAVKENVDFISLNFDDDVTNDSLSDVMIESSPEPQQPRREPLSFSHRERLHGTQASYQHTPQTQAPSFTPINAPQQPTRTIFDAEGPPEPPPGFVMPTDEELMYQYTGETTSKKRKYEDIRSRPDDAIIDEWRPRGGNPTPWYRFDHTRTTNLGLRLHLEICDFYDFVKPHTYEDEVRRQLIRRVEHATQTASVPGARNARIYCFGSFAAKLYLPTADMDLVAVSPSYMSRGMKAFCQGRRPMFNLAGSFERAGVAPPAGVIVIHKAKVPILKFVDKMTGIKVDVSFENDSGLTANKTFEAWSQEYPAMPVLVVLIKQLLAMRGLNEVFSGGIGGFTIICLVVSMMQLTPELQAENMDPEMHYADLLLNFLDLYGNQFDLRTTAIMLNPPGYYDKRTETQAKQNPDRLTIIDPNRPDNDISGGSHKIHAVLDCFRHAHAQLQRCMARVSDGQDEKSSILGCVLGGNYNSFLQQRSRLSTLSRGYPATPPPQPVPVSKSTQSGLPDKVQDLPRKRTRKAKKEAANMEGQQPQMSQRLNGAPPTHPLPPKPSVEQRQQPSGPDGAGGKPDPPPSKKKPKQKKKKQQAPKTTKGTEPKGAKNRKEARKEKRAKQFKAQFPNIPNVPNSLAVKDVNKLSQKHGFKMTDFNRDYQV